MDIKKLLIYAVMWFFIVMGITLTGFIIHETVHLGQAGVPAGAICYDFSYYTVMYTYHDVGSFCDNEIYKNAKICQESSEWTKYTEKWAYLIQINLTILGTLLFGFILGRKWKDGRQI